MNNKQTCLYYMQGRCRFGSRCYYSHEGFLEALMIRHAQSEFNKFSTLFPNEDFLGEESKAKFQFNKNMLDCPLSKDGIQQARKVQLPSEYIGSKKQIDIVFVSPLRRTLQTAQNIMQNNHLRVRKTIILPQLTEVLSKICDFSSSLQQKRKQFKQFDFSEMERYLKQNDHINGQKQWQDVLVDMDHYGYIQREQVYGQRYLQILENIFPKPLQNSERCFSRSLRALEIMKDLSTKHKATKIVIVSHNRILKYIDGRFSKGRASSFQNCQIRHLIF